jgi:hypothetical protein
VGFLTSVAWLLAKSKSGVSLAATQSRPDFS